MKEFLEKLIQELKEESIIVDNDAGHRAVEIIEQLAEEYNNDVCECKYHRTIDDIPMYKTSCLHEFEKQFVKKYKFCPYCRKKIKVVE